MQAIKDILPYVVLFYAFDFVIWQMSSEYSNRDSSLVMNIFFSSIFLFGFFVIDFFRARSRQKQAMQAGAQVVVVQQPIYMPPPGYQLTPIPPGQPGAPPPGAYYPPYPMPPPPAQPADPKGRPPEGSS